MHVNRRFTSELFEVNLFQDQELKICQIGHVVLVVVRLSGKAKCLHGPHNLAQV